MPSMVSQHHPQGGEAGEVAHHAGQHIHHALLAQQGNGCDGLGLQLQGFGVDEFPGGGHAEQGAQGGNQDDTQGEQREQGNGVGQAVARPLDASQYPAEQGRFIFSAFFSHAITSVTYNIVYSVADFR